MLFICLKKKEKEKETLKRNKNIVSNTSKLNSVIHNNTAWDRSVFELCYILNHTYFQNYYYRSMQNTM